MATRWTIVLFLMLLMGSLTWRRSPRGFELERVRTAAIVIVGAL
jgi:hypothetical protein